MRSRVPTGRSGRRVRRARPLRDDAVLLVGADDDEVGDRPAGEVADEAVALVDGLRRGAAVARHRHPAGVGDRPALLPLVADDLGQHRERDVVGRADADAGLEQVEEDADPGAELGQALEGDRAHQRRRRADADHRAGVAGGAQDRRRADDGQPLALGGGLEGRPCPWRRSSRRRGSARRAVPPAASGPRRWRGGARRRRASRPSDGRRRRSRSAPRAGSSGVEAAATASACSTLSRMTAKAATRALSALIRSSLSGAMPTP